MPFTKVVEQCKVYNFGIQMFAHFSSEILRKTILNEATPKGLAPNTRGNAGARATSRPATSVSPPYDAVHARRGRPASVGPCAAPFSPLCVTQAGPWSAPRGKPPLTGERHLHTPLDRRSCMSPRHGSPCRAIALTDPPQTASPPRAGFKSRRLPLARAHRAPLCAIEGSPLNVSSHLLSEPMHAPNPCSRPL
jgi:hypothetical protein